MTVQFKKVAIPTNKDQGTGMKKSALLMSSLALAMGVIVTHCLQ